MTIVCPTGCQSTRHTVNSSQPIIVWRVDCFVNQSCDELTVLGNDGLLLLAGHLIMRATNKILNSKTGQRQSGRLIDVLYTVYTVHHFSFRFSWPGIFITVFPSFSAFTILRNVLVCSLVVIRLRRLYWALFLGTIFTAADSWLVPVQHSNFSLLNLIMNISKISSSSSPFSSCSVVRQGIGQNLDCLITLANSIYSPVQAWWKDKREVNKKGK